MIKLTQTFVDEIINSISDDRLFTKEADGNYLRYDCVMFSFYPDQNRVTAKFMFDGKVHAEASCNVFPETYGEISIVLDNLKGQLRFTIEP
jgi:hypothetical protein